jgi:diadenosine tetraphosphate (Ap4A) HIT family hydrolase
VCDVPLTAEAARRELYDSKYLVGSKGAWLITVRRRQLTLGSCILLPKKATESFSQLGPVQMLGLRSATRAFECLMERTFGPRQFNYVISGQHHPILHVHAFPRYDKPVVWNTISWVDRRWPSFLQFPKTEPNDSEELRALVDFLRDSGQTAGLVKSPRGLR